MEANKIQIGDWVRLDYVDYLTKERIVKDFKVGQIRFLDWDGRGQMYVGDDHRNMAPVDNLKPIYLTDEILMKNSISTSEMPFGSWVYCLMEDEFNEVYVQLRTDSIWRVRIEHLEGNFINLIYVCTVHELQHALRLCGIEKEIEI